MDVSIKVRHELSGIKSLPRELQRAEADVREEEAPALEQVAKTLAPVRTGEYRDGLHAETAGRMIELYGDAPHTPYVEAKHHVFDEAFDERKAPMERELEQAISQAADRANR
jgi:hypothetical protein